MTSSWQWENTRHGHQTSNVQWGNPVDGTASKGNHGKTRKHNSTGKPTQTASSIKWKNILILAIKVGLFAALFVVVWLNWQPYIGMMHALLAQEARNPLVRWVQWALSNIPILGGLFRWLFSGIHSVFLYFLGILVWMFFQALELIPVMLENNTSLRNLIHGMLNFERLEIKESDTSEVKGLKRRYNNQPKRWLQQGYVIASIAYLADLVCCWVYYPPVQNLQLFLMSPSMDQVDWRNVGLAMLTLFSFEFAVWLIIYLDYGKKLLGINKMPKFN